MRPRSKDRGKFDHLILPDEGLNRFNEAAIKRSRKASPGFTSIRGGLCSFNEAAIKRSRKVTPL